ncbi:CHAP domain-containing protein [Nonomuraea diastatica]|uniref:CHAP domain-containing protein n=1 Tax=Nonomuraea diastatica TaxID=1848329 RepID=A0A4R4VZ03_9ACTN|nr:CHAP domain-containing protein [Nonomuraea diastatica]TDD05800.1 CHAP domain-containing protein [Nonomuraea diastatica]
MTPEMQKFIELLERQLGYSEKAGAYTKFGSWYGKNVEFDADYSSAPWCDMMLSWAAHKLGYDEWIGQFAWTVAHAKWFKEQGAWGKKPKPGAIVFYDWSGSNKISRIDHVGVVTRVEGGTIYTIEGNIDGGVAKRKERDTSKVVGYGYPEEIKARLDEEAAQQAKEAKKKAEERAEEPSRPGNDVGVLELPADEALSGTIPRAERDEPARAPHSGGRDAAPAPAPSKKAEQEATVQGSASATGKEPAKKAKHAKPSTADTTAATADPHPTHVDASVTGPMPAVSTPTLVGSALVAALALLAVAKTRRLRAAASATAGTGTRPARSNAGRRRRRNAAPAPRRRLATRPFDLATDAPELRTTDTAALRSPRHTTDTTALRSPRHASDTTVLRSPRRAGDTTVPRSPDAAELHASHRLARAGDRRAADTGPFTPAFDRTPAETGPLEIVLDTGPLDRVVDTGPFERVVIPGATSSFDAFAPTTNTGDAFGPLVTVGHPSGVHAPFPATPVGAVAGTSSQAHPEALAGAPVGTLAGTSSQAHAGALARAPVGALGGTPAGSRAGAPVAGAIGASGPLASPTTGDWFPGSRLDAHSRNDRPGRTSGGSPNRSSGGGRPGRTSGGGPGRTSGGPYRGRRRHERLAEEPAFASDLPSRGRRHRRSQPGPPDVQGPRPSGAPQPARAPYAGRQEPEQHGPAGLTQSRRSGEGRSAEGFVQDLPLKGRRHRRTTRPDDGRQLAAAATTRPGKGRHRA